VRVRRAEIVDAYVEDDRAAIFVGDMVLTLSELATSAWLAIGEDWTSAVEVTSALTAEYGAPPPPSDPQAATEGVLRDLADRGVVQLEDDGG
jgi:hypothetical protein